MSYLDHQRRSAEAGPFKLLLKRLIPQAWRDRVYPARERLARIPFNLRARWRILWELRVLRRPVADLGRYEFRVSSQNAEDGAIAAIFAAIGTTSRRFVEFGVDDGTVCNTARLRRLGWDGLQMDPREGNPPFIKREFVTAENVNALFARYGVPPEFDLLSVDIDGNDYWVWKAIEGYRPRAVVVEYNSNLPPDLSVTVRYDPAFRTDGTAYFGASLLALERLGRRKGYVLVGCDSMGVNAFFVREDLAAGRFATSRDVRVLYREMGPGCYRAPAAPPERWVAID